MGRSPNKYNTQKLCENIKCPRIINNCPNVYLDHLGQRLVELVEECLLDLDHVNLGTSYDHTHQGLIVCTRTLPNDDFKDSFEELL